MMREFISVAKGAYHSSSATSNGPSHALASNHVENDNSHMFSRVSDYIAGHENHGRYVEFIGRATALSYEERISNLSEKT